MLRLPLLSLAVKKPVVTLPVAAPPLKNELTCEDLFATVQPLAISQGRVLSIYCLFVSFSLVLSLRGCCICFDKIKDNNITWLRDMDKIVRRIEPEKREEASRVQSEC